MFVELVSAIEKKELKLDSQVLEKQDFVSFDSLIGSSEIMSFDSPLFVE